MGSHQETLGIGERLVAGSLAGAIAQSSIYPMEVSVQARQVSVDQNTTLGHVHHAEDKTREGGQHREAASLQAERGQLDQQAGQLTSFSLKTTR